MVVHKQVERENPNYRNRLVGREITRNRRLELFAATPPLEAFKMPIYMCVQGQERHTPMRLAVIDVKRAYFYAPTHRAIFI